MLIYIQVVLISNQPKQSKAMSIYKRIEELHITLPPVATPAAAYVPFVRTGNLVFLSGHISKNAGRVWTGQLGLTLQTEEGKAAARAVAIDLLGTLHAAVGDLNKVKRIVTISEIDYSPQPMPMMQMRMVRVRPDYARKGMVSRSTSAWASQGTRCLQSGVMCRSSWGSSSLSFRARS
jgi:enamine deaminase RidA (YjgF/YER057c/UK114 family)